MSTRRPLRLLGLAGCAGLLLGISAPAQTGSAARHAAGAAVRVVTGTPVGQSVRVFAERRVRNTEGEELGTIRDVLVDAHSGKIAYAAVASRIGGDLRLVPFTALQAELGSDGFVVAIAADQWRQIAPASARGFEVGRLTVSEAERRDLAMRFGQTTTSDAAADSLSASTGTLPKGGLHLVRLGDLRGKRVSTGTEDVGTIDDVVVIDGQTAVAAVILPERDFAPPDQKFVIPLQLLNLASREQSPIGTTLTRADLQQALLQRADAMTNATPSPRRDGEPQLGPTGRTLTEPPQAAPLSLPHVMSAVQRMLADEPAPSAASVRVEQENGTVRIQGSVHSLELKNRIEGVVRQAAPGAPIENHLRVQAR